MYLTNDGYTHYRDGSQCRSRGLFLILVQLADGPASGEIRGIVRKVAMKQLGNFMMGRARVKGETVILSGAYGGDGLPCGVSANVFSAGVKLPDELRDAWNKGGGWNSAGSEADAMRAWALRELVKK